MCTSCVFWGAGLVLTSGKGRRAPGQCAAEGRLHRRLGVEQAADAQGAQAEGQRCWRAAGRRQQLGVEAQAAQLAAGRQQPAQCRQQRRFRRLRAAEGAAKRNAFD